MKIAVDGMGSDKSPAVEAAGVVEAARELDCDIILVGDEPALKRELERYRPCPKNISTCHASEVVGMAEAAPPTPWSPPATRALSSARPH
jgi:glycerol-3-phosphate acyltransferase PlsX